MVKDTNIFIFTSYSCEYCEKLIIGLTENNITYNDIKIEDYPEIWYPFILQTKTDKVPVLLIRQGKDSNNVKPYLPDVDFNTINELIEIIKKL